METKTLLTRILRERLDQYKVPAEVRDALCEEILSAMERPERKPFGATVMTQEASLAADQARKRGRAEKTDAKPKVI